MSSNVTNHVSFLRTSREFPEEIKELAFQVSKSYIDIANVVNTRTIGIFPVNRAAITGNSWFLTSRRQQTLRQVYSFTSTADIDIGFKISSIFGFVQLYGVYNSGTAWFGLIPATSVAIAGQISFYVDVNGASTTSDVIKFVVGGGAPALTSGTIVLEWLSLV